MTLDEAIQYCEEQIDLLEELTEGYDLYDQVEKQIAYINGECAKEHRQLADWLKELKKLREQTSWIPCSERLPNFPDVYIVTRHYPNNVLNPNYLVDACFFDGSNWYNDNRINHERNYADNVIAWQENPEPYKADSEVEE